MKKTYLLFAVFVLLGLSSFVSAGELKPDLSDIISKTPFTPPTCVNISFSV